MRPTPSARLQVQLQRSLHSLFRLSQCGSQFGLRESNESTMNSPCARWLK